jgi:hypothetical protein
MKHDEFCPSPSTDDDVCNACVLIAIVRRDEQDQIEGDSELDIHEIKAIAYADGYNDGVKSVPKSEVSSGGIDLSKIQEYIMNRIATLTVQDTNALYAMYVHFGGK